MAMTQRSLPTPQVAAPEERGFSLPDPGLLAGMALNPGGMLVGAGLARLLGNSGAKEANGLDGLQDGGIFDTVTEDEASRALAHLTSLDPDARKAALDAMDGEAFQSLLDELPVDQWKRLGPVFEAVSDPGRKLQAWSSLHKGRAAELAGEMERPSWLDDGPGAEAARHRDAVRKATIDDTMAEVDEEVAFLRERMARGDEIGAQDIEDLDARKSYELQIERRQGVNLTNDRGPSGLASYLPGTASEMRERRRTWGMGELSQAEYMLSSLPPSLVRDNRSLSEIRRQAAHPADLDASSGVSGQTLSVYDPAGATPDGVTQAVGTGIGTMVAHARPELVLALQDTGRQHGHDYDAERARRELAGLIPRMALDAGGTRAELGLGEDTAGLRSDLIQAENACAQEEILGAPGAACAERDEAEAELGRHQARQGLWDLIWKRAFLKDLPGPK